MVTGLLFAAALVVIALIVHWTIINDGAGDTGETKGLFAMRDNQAPRENETDRRFKLPER
ncbi:MAG: hypothetical protein KIT20_00175 [Alphaproteobacteria bacterium]|nr:hypothetical protein [Alphaproteobacteria bacterium]